MMTHASNDLDELKEEFARLSNRRQIVQAKISALSCTDENEKQVAELAMLPFDWTSLASFNGLLNESGQVMFQWRNCLGARMLGERRARLVLGFLVGDSLRVSVFLLLSPLLLALQILGAMLVTSTEVLAVTLALSLFAGSLLCLHL